MKRLDWILTIGLIVMIIGIIAMFIFINSGRNECIKDPLGYAQERIQTTTNSEEAPLCSCTKLINGKIINYFPNNYNGTE